MTLSSHDRFDSLTGCHPSSLVILLCYVTPGTCLRVLILKMGKMVRVGQRKAGSSGLMRVGTVRPPTVYGQPPGKTSKRYTSGSLKSPSQLKRPRDGKEKKVADFCLSSRHRLDQLRGFHGSPRLEHFCVMMRRTLSTSVRLLCLGIVCCLASQLDENGGTHSHESFTNILNELLETYERRVRPGISGMFGPPTKILVDVNIRSMGPISEVDMTYSMDAYFRQTWVDKRLCFNGSHEMMAVQIKLLEKIWKPDTYFYNGHEAYLHTITSPNKLLRIMKNGTILYSMRLTIKAKCPMYLQYFPMDEQSCPLQIGSYAYTKDQIHYEWKYGPGRSIKASSDMRLSTFDLIGYPAWNVTIRRTGGEYSTLKVNFKLRRHTGYFLIQVYVPSALIVILSWVTFWLNREASADRVGLGITCFLTLTTLSMDTRDALPKVSYATALDWFVITCFIFVISSLLEVAGVHYFTKIGSGEPNLPQSEEDYDDDEEDDTEPNGEVYTYQVNNHGYYYQSGVSMLRKRVRQTRDPRLDPCFYRFWKCLQGSSHYKKLMRRHSQRSGVNSVSKIDKMSRILFPLVFIMFNVIYWISYSK
ncbi:hypothetical protein LSH36_474g04060 [Paralvinella palmiformis]|uniref:Uncharacterized protein n=1 Tax=Paralvinella palmiformis TaxID=53620 RepID=A0AAD9MZ14_9ANNE|nr:hypothetical protein LSH36_474g04060 [Paralvinella palmiformis]